MALKDTNCANHPDTIKAMVGETIGGVIQDDQGRWWLVVRSGHALVFGNENGAFWVETPEAVRRLIARRKESLGTWAAETERLMAIDMAIEAGL